MAAAAVVSASLVAPPARAAAHDGRWSVVVVTESGNCDQAYRYEVAVDGGRIRYAGPENVDFSGSVAASGAVSVNIRLGEQGAQGSGKLAANAGSGTWKGTGKNGACAGRWEAEKR
ncbi:MAG: hypothetical protein JSR72_19605 [Proteobacteria bacterium]|nr:hypothetical protein [Pseudomonadota bacterium]